MIDKIGRSVSAIATIYEMWSIGKMINPVDYPIGMQIFFGGIGLIFSLVWTFYIMGSFVESLNKSALLRYGLVPALMWVLNTPVVFNTYMDVVIDREYSIKKEKYVKEIEPINKKISEVQAKLEKEEAKEINQRGNKLKELRAFERNKEAYISKLEAKYKIMRKAYKKMSWSKKRDSEYRRAFTLCERKGYHIPSDVTAPNAIATCNYEIKIKELNSTSSSLIGDYKRVLDGLKAQKQKMKTDIEAIEKRNFIPVWLFYIGMFLFGYFIEIKFANASFWIEYEKKRGLTKELEKVEETAMIAYNQNLYDVGATAKTATEAKRPITLKEATFNAIIRATYKENLALDELDYKIVQRYMTDINPKTKKPFVAKKYQKKIRDFLKSKGYDNNKNKHGFIENVKKEVISVNM